MKEKRSQLGLFPIMEKYLNVIVELSAAAGKEGERPMKKLFLGLMCLGLLGIGFIACEQVDDSGTQQTEVGAQLSGLENDAFLVSRHNNSNLVGSSGSIDFEAKQTGKVVTVTVMGENYGLVAEIDYKRTAFILDGLNAMLTEKEKAELSQLVADLESYLSGTKKITVLEESLVQTVGYWSVAPLGHIYSRMEVQNSSLKGGIMLMGASSDEGVTCIRKSTWVTAVYDDSIYPYDHWEPVFVGSNAAPGWKCQGRCGAGCGVWYIPSSWTKDCLDHDQCSFRNNSSGGGSDPNCGDEYYESADDWLLGVWAGCWG